MIHPDQFLESTKPGKEGTPTLNEAEMDDQAWKEIVTCLDIGRTNEAKVAFMTRCAESAIEARQDSAKVDKKRRTALEKVEPELRDIMDGPMATLIKRTTNRNQYEQIDLSEGVDVVRGRLQKLLDGLTPTTEDKETS